MFINWYVDKQTVAHPYRGILLSNKKEWTTDTTQVNPTCIVLTERKQT